MEYSKGPLASKSTNAVISPAGSFEAELAGPIKRVLRNTYALLAMTLLFSAAVASTAVALQWRSPDMIMTLAGYFGLLFAIHKMQNSAWAIPAVFALTGLGLHAGTPGDTRSSPARRCSNRVASLSSNRRYFYDSVGLRTAYTTRF